MRNASGHQCKVKMNGSEKKVNTKTYDISSIHFVVLSVNVRSGSNEEIWSLRGFFTVSLFSTGGPPP